MDRKTQKAAGFKTHQSTEVTVRRLAEIQAEPSLGPELPPLGPHFLDGTKPEKTPQTPGFQT